MFPSITNILSYLQDEFICWCNRIRLQISAYVNSQTYIFLWVYSECLYWSTIVWYSFNSNSINCINSVVIILDLDDPATKQTFAPFWHHQFHFSLVIIQKLYKNLWSITVSYRDTRPVTFINSTCQRSKRKSRKWSNGGSESRKRAI